jgi:hypothetical protein
MHSMSGTAGNQPEQFESTLRAQLARMRDRFDRNVVPPAQRDRYETILRSQLDQYRTRYASGAVPPVIHLVIRVLETELAWLAHLRVRP